MANFRKRFLIMIAAFARAQRPRGERDSSPTFRYSWRLQPKEESIVSDSQPLSEKSPEFWLLLGTLIAAGIAAYYTRQQWITADDYERRALRAYVGILDHTNVAQNNGLPPNIPHFIFKLKNSGQTPAFKVIRNGGIAVDKYPLPESFDFKPSQNLVPIEPISIFPGVEWPLPIFLSRPLTTDEAAHISDGKNWRLYLYGDISYIDTFGRRHYTNYCFGYHVINPSVGVLETCSQNNDAE